MFDVNEYNVICRKTMVDGEQTFESRVLELPDVSGYGDTREAATEAALEAIRGLYALALQRGIDFPAPIPSVPSEYSGRVTLRMSSGLHWQVAMAAAKSGVSLNSVICEAVAAHVMDLDEPRAVLSESQHRVWGINAVNFGNSLFFPVAAGSTYCVRSGQMAGGPLEVLVSAGVKYAESGVGRLIGHSEG